MGNEAVLQRINSFETHPDNYRHWSLSIDGHIATLALSIQEENGLRPNDYTLKQNSYDMGVDIELNDAVQRLRFEHPEVRVVLVTSLLPKIFCAGANIRMLATSAHGFKVNFASTPTRPVVTSKMPPRTPAKSTSPRSTAPLRAVATSSRSLVKRSI